MGRHFLPATAKFLVEMSFAYSWVKQNEHVSDYKVTVTRSGENTGLPCLSHITKEKTVTVERNRQFIIGEKQVPEQLAERACEALL